MDAPADPAPVDAAPATPAPGSVPDPVTTASAAVPTRPDVPERAPLPDPAPGAAVSGNVPTAAVAVPPPGAGPDGGSAGPAGPPTATGRPAAPVSASGGAPGPAAGHPGASTAACAPEDAPFHPGSADLDGRAAGPARALSAVELAALLAREAGGDGADAADLVARVADSVRRTAMFVAERRERPGPAEPELPFLDSEQALLLGHPMHPAPKGREGLSDAENAAYSPELRGRFPLHWLAVHPSVLACDSAWTERGRPIQATALLAGLAGAGLRLPEGAAPLPLHPWQARDIRHRPGVRALFEAGLLHDLGPQGEPWYATSSVRTVYRPDAPAMLKLSLGLRITNSRRENLRKELRRGTEVHRLLRSGLAAQWHAAHPGFDIVRDPAWLGVDTPEGRPVPGLDVVLRHNPFGPGDQAHCVAGLTSPRPWPGRPAAEMRSLLAVLVDRLAARTGRRTTAVATEWFLRYLDTVVRPVLWLDGHAGVALEAHQQNTLVLLDADGWPRGGRYRDNQGYYFRESRRADLERRLPGIGSASDTFVPDEVADERFAYYLGINNVLGLIGAFGSQQLAAEEVLLAAFRRFLATADGHGSRLPGRLLGEPELRCKANLLTRLHGLDELVGPVDTQSVYVTLPNPVAATAAPTGRPTAPAAEES
ncbi:IucA/IucC family protein [Actinacidiphila sp. DG2A-62]|uniref:IucA/IucC family protein n=1 Tax=Actinacidiphila sp. DG2A-62 TaxID=3108821 RepID=UPI003FA35636